MNPQEQIKAIAELDGWKPLAKSIRIKTGWTGYANAFWLDGSNVPQDKLPSYLTSRDAIIPVIEKLWNKGDVNMITFCENFKSNCCLKHDASKLLFETPQQLSEALLRATGKWKDEP